MAFPLFNISIVEFEHCASKCDDSNVLGSDFKHDSNFLEDTNSNNTEFVAVLQKNLFWDNSYDNLTAFIDMWLLRKQLSPNDFTILTF